MKKSSWYAAVSMAVCVILIAASCSQQQPVAERDMVVKPDGSVVINNAEVPLSGLMSAKTFRCPHRSYLAARASESKPANLCMKSRSTPSPGLSPFSYILFNLPAFSSISAASKRTSSAHYRWYGTGCVKSRLNSRSLLGHLRPKKTQPHNRRLTQ